MLITRNWVGSTKIKAFNGSNARLFFENLTFVIQIVNIFDRLKFAKVSFMILSTKF